MNCKITHTILQRITMYLLAKWLRISASPSSSTYAMSTIFPNCKTTTLISRLNTTNTIVENRKLNQIMDIQMNVIT